MSLFQLIDYPNYVVCDTKKKVYSLSTGKLIEMLPENKNTRSFNLNTVVDGKRKKLFMTFNKLMSLDMKPYGSDISVKDIKKTIRQGDTIESRYQQLPSPYHNYVYDTFEKELYSLHRNELRIMTNQGSLNNKRWQASFGFNQESKTISTLMVNSMIEAKLTTDFKYKPMTDVYWIVVNISIGTVMPERYGNAVDAGEVARNETLNTGLDHYIFKLVGKAEYTDDCEVKLEKMVG